ncbi:carboxypeptidase-like regulatory domain-containing protein [Salegentibacter chungangensis]|uniref:Carboxypeptidase-like regulatory domain-containing protein n=1 Tax=Salegentibacter chungangensis TaxID=1335724 RepID=A0ABW3NSK1_9FLAO
MSRNLFFLLVFFPFLMFSQEDTLLKGNIITSENDSTLINVINLTKRTGTVSAYDGYFEIRVRENDSLLFSSVQYENLKIKVTAELIEEKFLEINLKEANNRLDEVRISTDGLTGNLQKDIAKIEVYKSRVPLYTPGPDIVTRKISAMSNPMDPVGLLYGAISGEKKKLKKARGNIKRSSLVNRAYHLLRPEIFTEVLKLQRNEVMDFLHFCVEDKKMTKLVRQQQKLDLLQFFKEKLPHFIEIRRLD